MQSQWKENMYSWNLVYRDLMWYYILFEENDNTEKKEHRPFMFKILSKSDCQIVLKIRYDLYL